jgi:hypothetical protein
LSSRQPGSACTGVADGDLLALSALPRDSRKLRAAAILAGIDRQGHDLIPIVEVESQHVPR